MPTGRYSFLLYAVSPKNVLNDLAFENIEALALTEEDPEENFKCYGWGDIRMSWKKVEVKYSGFQIKSSYEKISYIYHL